VTIDLDLDGIEGGLGEPCDRHPVVRQKAELSLAGVPARLLDGLLNPREQTEALVREKHLALREAHVDPPELAPREEVDYRLGVPRVFECPAKRLPKPQGTGKNGTESLTAAAADSLSVASPPIATRYEKVASHVLVQRASWLSSRNARTLTA